MVITMSNFEATTNEMLTEEEVYALTDGLAKEEEEIRKKAREQQVDFGDVSVPSSFIQRSLESGNKKQEEVKEKETVPDIVETFIDRELSWIQFNERVIDQARRDDIPLQEKLVFLGHAASNLDEFISVRFSEVYLKAQNTDSVDYADNLSLYGKLLEQIREQKSEIAKLESELTSNEIISSKMLGVVGVDEQHLEEFFKENVFPALTPISVENNKEIPKFDDEDINIFIELKDTDKDKKSTYCILPIPKQLKRVFKIGNAYFNIEDLVTKNLALIFSNKVVENFAYFKVNKNYSEEVDHNTSIKILDRANAVVKKRRENNIVFLDISTNEENFKSEFIKALIKFTRVPKKHVCRFGLDRRLGLQFLKTKPYKKIFNKAEDYVIPPEWKSDFEPVYPKELLGFDSLFEYLDENEDLVIHHPYESYDVVLSFIKEAASNPNVVSIKQTLYRVSSEKSPIIKALCEAARNGIRVTVMLELLARFDEVQNIKLVDKLKAAGVTVIYSMEKIKTHCKMCIVTKSTKRGIKTYTHVSTGNYNEKTAQSYADISYFTSRNDIATDLTSVFNMITGFSKPTNTEVISFSPLTLRSTIEKEIDYLFDNASSKQPGYIDIKVNSLSDREMVNKLYFATDNPNLHVRIIARGICSMTNLNDQIEIKSVIGKFFEHSRIYIFRYNGFSKVYISSADLLTRNLDKRIEILVPISDNCKQKVIDIFDTLWEDRANSYWMREDGKYLRSSECKPDVENKSCYDSFII